MAALDDLERRLDELCKKAAHHAIELRRQMHQHPELSWEEHETQALLKQRLEGFGYGPEVLAKTGLIADIGTGDKGVLYRADMDALPIRDEKDKSTSPVVSCVDGVSHSCGHDIHCGVAIGLAEVFATMRDELPGRVRFVFQPAEEVVPSGADAMINEGAADDMKACYALHADPMRIAGHVGVRTGAMTAAGDAFHIEVLGEGGHAARPYLARDPIIAAARIVQNLSSLVAQRVNPLESAVVTVGEIHGGTAPNVIPGRVTLAGTIRSFTEETRSLLHAAIEEVAHTTAEANQCYVETRVDLGAPSLINDGELDAIVRSSARDALGDEAVELVELPSTGSEDFSYFAEKAPIYMLRLGVQRKGRAAHHLHTALFNPDESAIEVAMRVMGRALLRTAAG